MPQTLTYPGVYIEEVPSGVRTITGVATSITAFVGRAQRGPVNIPITINSYADFERTFGGLWTESRLGFSVRDFYNNGGTQAVIVRLYQDGPDPPFASISANGLILEASAQGAWGNAIRVRIESIDPAFATEIAENLGVTAADLFTLRVRDMKSGIEEEYRNVTAVESARRVDRLLDGKSQLVRVTTLIAPSAHPDPPPGTSEWDDANASSGIVTEGSDGLDLEEASFTGPGLAAAKEGLFALERVDLFNLLCIPPYLTTDGITNQDVDDTLIASAAKYCEDRRAFLIVDPPSGWVTKGDAKTGIATIVKSKNAAIFFPRLMQRNPLRADLVEAMTPSGGVAGIIARTDAARGPWKAPAGIETDLRGPAALSVALTNLENGELNPLGVNCLRTFPASGHVVWGARTLRGDDRLASEWKYIPVRRLTLFVEESLYRGTQWVVHEPNDEPLWAQIRLNAGAFMQNLYRQGAFQGRSPREAYFVKCDAETTTQNDINLGVVNILVGFAPLKPAEFVVIKIQQMAGQVQA
jgi:phage tail sheath protein FI